ncbi:MAG TPA: pyruvate dehydrogenase (acetyl-transferring) E1 component subunit alpha [Clostridia bacterium]|nr:pyruvate dehydrogenase (acetyl-transferring) E1 component subunit alpha [Clostridia bacterium]
MNRVLEVDKYDRGFLIQLLREMLLIRRFEEKAGQMYGLQKIGGFCHLYIGQEAIATGSIAALNLEKDYVLTAYRDHGHAISCGMDPDVIMAELYGKETGCSRGKGGSMHLFDVDKHMYGGHGIVGSHIPLATGVALKIKYNKEDGVVLCYFGDGAIHQGAFHESLNMAKIWDLPIVFICENNQYGMGTSVERVSSVHDFYIMGDSYGIKGKQVDGMNVLEVYEETVEAVKKARDEGLPSFLEIKTYRYRGHSMSDPAKYRSREELNEYRQQDPIVLLKEAMIEKEMLTEEDYKKMDDECKDISNKSVEFAENSDEPSLESLYEDILA